MPTINEMLQEVEQQEKNLEFEDFTSETALQIGMSIIQRAKNENMVITVDIRRNRHQLFHYAFQGTSPDNDLWVVYKSNVVDRLNISSHHLHLMLEKSKKTLEDIHLDPVQYGPWGGAFPVTVKNVGVVGSISISGLSDSEDHALAV